MIDEKLVDNELKELKVSISDKEVDAAVDEVKKSYNLTDDQLQQAVSKEGLLLAEYREQMRKQIGRYKLISEKVRKNVKVSDADVKSEYDRMTRTEGEDYEVHVRHILIAVPRNASPGRRWSRRAGRRRRWPRRRASPGWTSPSWPRSAARAAARRTAATSASSSAARWCRSSSGWPST